MPLLRNVAEEISNNHLVAGVIEEIITEESLYALLPFTQVNGKAYVYNRETKLADSNFMAQNTPIEDSASEFKSVTTHLKILIGDVDVDKFLDSTMSDVVSQKAVQLAMKAKGMGRRFKDALINGGSARMGPNGNAIDAAEATFEFAGIRKIWTDGIQDSGSYSWPIDSNLPTLTPPHPDTEAPTFTNWKEFWTDQVIMMNVANPDNSVDDADVQPDALTLSKLDELIDAIPYHGVDCLMMRKDTYRAYKAILRNAGGITPDQIMIRNFGMVPAHDGVPIIINDYLPTLTGTDGSSGTPPYTEIYALRLNEVDGLHGLYGGSNAGIVVEDIGTVQNKDATRTRMKWYCGLALKSTKSMAVLRGVAV